MKSEESTEDSDNDKEALTTREQLEVLQHKVLMCQEISEKMPHSTLQVLCDQSKLWEATTQLTKEVKRTGLNMIVQVCITAVIGLLNIFTDLSLNYS